MEMSELRLQMNEYLALEFSTHGTSSVNVPFVLTLAHQDSDLVIFEFDEMSHALLFHQTIASNTYPNRTSGSNPTFEAWLPNSLDSLLSQMSRHPRLQITKLLRPHLCDPAFLL